MTNSQISKRPDAAAKAAFTLVELLVVMAVIALLAAMLLPMCAKAKQAARSAQCRSNVRQLGLGLRMYVDDNNGYPLAAGYGSLGWASLLAGAYLGDMSVSMHQSLESITPSVLLCPARLRKPHTIEGTFSISYGYNDIGYARLGLGGTLDSVTRPLVSPIRDSSIAAPSQMLSIGDGATRASGGELIEGQELQRWVSEATVAEMGSDISLHSKALYAQHRGYLQIGLCDGHVESPPISRLLFDASAEALSLWNRDHLPHPDYLNP